MFLHRTGRDKVRLDLNQLPERTGEAMPRENRTGPIRFGDEPGRRAGCHGEGELRCGCGSLLARVVRNTVELKCRRCKRTWNIPLERS
jgi:hypothetical protein